MFKNLTFRWIAIITVLTFALFKLYPTFKYYNMSEEEKLKLSTDNPAEFKELENLAINLGLFILSNNLIKHYFK